MSMLNLSAQIDVKIPMRDGGYLVADVFRPAEPGEYPVLIAVGPYGKDLPFHEFNPQVYSMVPRKSPYMVWETPDPAWWVPHGYVVVRADMRGMRKSPGLLTLHYAAELDDYCDAIEWAGTQDWSNGKVGMSGVSYFAFTQWQVAARNPRCLAAILPWEGFSDFYREEQRHGGIFSNGFVDERWYALRILQGQNGQGLAGEPLLSDEVRAKNRAYELPQQVRENELLNDTYDAMTAVLENIKVPVYSSGNWGGMGLHLRGCIEGFKRVGSRDKWLEMHSGNFVYSYYGDEGLETQLRFFDFWLKGIDNGLMHTKRVKLAVRTGAGNAFRWRWEDEWPIARTQWKQYRLDASAMSIGEKKISSESSVSYSGENGAAHFKTAPLDEAIEITGPMKLKIWVSSSTVDMDVFVDLRQFDAKGNEVLVENTYLSNGPVAKGWLRASHRKLDPAKSLEYQPYHTHDELQKLSVDDVVELDVEIWPTSMVFSKGNSLQISLTPVDGSVCGQFYHDDPVDRPLEVFIEGTYTVHTGGRYDSYLVLPIIPSKGNV